MHHTIQTICRRSDLISAWAKRVAEPQPAGEGIIVPRVLVVDDDPMVCVAIELCLTRQGFEVTVADGGEAGMRALESSRFDVMLIDVFMPHMRGFESIRMFHERLPDVPVVAMSGYAFANTERAPDFLRMTIELGAACCLRKPFTPSALLTTINECLNKPKASAHISNK
jgi:CheY-like chemotaxis protein